MSKKVLFCCWLLIIMGCSLNQEKSQLAKLHRFHWEGTSLVQFPPYQFRQQCSIERDSTSLQINLFDVGIGSIGGGLFASAQIDSTVTVSLPKYPQYEDWVKAQLMSFPFQSVLMEIDSIQSRMEPSQRQTIRGEFADYRINSGRLEQILLHQHPIEIQLKYFWGKLSEVVVWNGKLQIWKLSLEK